MSLHPEESAVMESVPLLSPRRPARRRLWLRLAMAGLLPLVAAVAASADNAAGVPAAATAPAAATTAAADAAVTAEAAAVDEIRPLGPVELIQDGFQFTEGPAWHADTATLFFSDIPANTIFALTADGQIKPFTERSGHTNGIISVTSGPYAGQLLACQMDGQVVAYDVKSAESRVLAAEFEQVRFNAPNDLVLDSHGGIYFTDPLYRAPDPLPQSVQTVYYLAADGMVSRVTEPIKAPNGVALSPAGDRLYVIPSQQAEMLVYEIQTPGKLGPPQVLCSLRQPEGKRDSGGDGMAVDVQGNLYITADLGVLIYSPAGEYRGLVQTPQVPANVTFGGEDRKTLYITARTGLYRVAMPIAGQPPN